MVCDKITYGGQILLTLYHQGFLTSNLRKITQKIGHYNLVFEETDCSNEEDVLPVGWFMKEEGLILKDSFMNPYGSAACAYMEHFCYAIKPKRLFRIAKSKSEYSLAIQAQDFLKIGEFIEKYTGFPISKKPMNYGDIFVYQHRLRCYHAKQADGIVVENLPANAMIIVKFQRNSVIVTTKIARITVPTKEIEILADVLWDSHDIEIYVDDQLVFYDRDVSYIRKIQLNFKVETNATKVKLDKIAELYQIEHLEEFQTTNIHYNPNDIEEVLNRSNQLILKRMNAEHPDSGFEFICPNEGDKALNLIGKTMQSALDSLWIFDPYFTDTNHLAKTIDWLRIIAQCKAQEKNIVFFVKNEQNALDPSKLIEKIQADYELERLLRNGSKLGIHLYQTCKPIHDRFVLTESNNMLSGLALGTSFNSLDENHYCIFHLGDYAAKKIWEELHSWMMIDGAIISKSEV